MSRIFHGFSSFFWNPLKLILQVFGGFYIFLTLSSRRHAECGISSRLEYCTVSKYHEINSASVYWCLPYLHVNTGSWTPHILAEFCGTFKEECFRLNIWSYVIYPKLCHMFIGFRTYIICTFRCRRKVLTFFHFHCFQMEQKILYNTYEMRGI